MKKVLYVEDDNLVARFYSDKLVQAGFEVLIAEDGLAAMKQLMEFKPDLVVLDLLLPKMGGADVLKFMCERQELKSIPVIIFSNYFLGNLTAQVPAARIEKSLIKSDATPAQLVDAVKEVLEAPNLTTTESSPTIFRIESSGQAPSGAAPPGADQVAPVIETEEEFCNRVRRESLEKVPAIIKSVRQICREFIEFAGDSSRPQLLNELSREIGSLAQMSGLAGCHRIAQLASALEALLLDLENKPEAIDDSSRQTVAATVAFLLERLDSTTAPEERLPPALVLVVDDDAVSNRALVLGLNLPDLQVTAVTDPFDAVKALQTTAYDVVLLDIDMPGLDGIALCERMRAIPRHKRTPVIFVTGHADFKNRAHSILSGGDDLIAKPVLPIEVVVKAITLLLRKTQTASSAAGGSRG